MFSINEIPVTFSCELGDADIELLLKREPFWSNYLGFLTVGGSLMASINSSSIKLKKFYSKHMYCTYYNVYRTLRKHYIKNNTLTFLNLLGNMSIIGNPAGLIDSIGEGIHGLASEYGNGNIKKGTSKFFQSTAKGLMNTVGGITNGISSALNNSVSHPHSTQQEMPMFPDPPHKKSKLYTTVKSIISKEHIAKVYI